MDSQNTTLSFDKSFLNFDRENYVQLWTSFPYLNMEGNRYPPGLRETSLETLAAQPEVDIVGPLPSEDSLILPDECLEFLQERQAQEQRLCRNGLPPTEIQHPTLSTTEKLPCEAPGPDPLPCPKTEVREEAEERASGPVKTKKREWVRFSLYQKQILMERFKVNRNLSTKDVEELSSQLGLSSKQVRNWFQNERKKFKKRFPSEDSLVLPDECLEFLQEREAQEQRLCGNVLPPPEIQHPTLSTTEKLPCEAPGPDPLSCPVPEAREEAEEGAPGLVKTNRRKGLCFSPYQKQILMECFKVNRNLTTKDVEALASQLGLSPKQVQDWFQNERKKFKKRFPSEDSLVLPDECLEFLQEREAQEQRLCGNVLPPPEVQGPSLSTTEKLPCEAPGPDPLSCPVPEAREEAEEGAPGLVKTNKRKGVRFSLYQKQILMECFKVNRNLTTKDVEALASQLGLSPKQVQDWFQNKRKKFKKRFPSEDSLVLPDECLEFLQERQAQEQRLCGNGLPPPEVQGPTLSTTEKLPCEAAGPDPLPCPKTEVREEAEKGASSPVKPKKRERTRFSPYQKQVLMEHFKGHEKLTTKDVEDLSSQLGLSPKQVREWFRNERKKFKKWFPLLLNGEQGVDCKRS